MRADLHRHSPATSSLRTPSSIITPFEREKRVRKVIFLCVASIFAIYGNSSFAETIQWKTEDGGNGHWYDVVYVADGITWTDANNAATASGGYLASITSAEENAFVYSLITDRKYWTDLSIGDDSQGPWIGGYRDNSDGQWKWTSGETFSYTSWYSAQPDSYGDDYTQRICFDVGGANTSSCWCDHPDASCTGYERPRAYIVESAVPEPSTLVLLGVGVASLLGFVRYRRRK
jgi:hypothetical protein